MRRLLLLLILCVGAAVAADADVEALRDAIVRADTQVASARTLLVTPADQDDDPAGRAASARYLFEHAAQAYADVLAGAGDLPGVRRDAAYGRAKALAALGDLDGAFAALDAAADTRPLPRPFFDRLHDDPGLGPLRDDPRMAAFLAAVAQARSDRLRAEAEALLLDEPMPLRLKGPGLSGDRVDTKALRGQPVVLVVFGIWNHDSREAWPALLELRRQTGDAASWVGLDYERGAPFATARGKVEGYADKRGLTFDLPLMFLTRGQFEKLPGPPSIPRMLVLDPEGRVVAQHEGTWDPELFTALMQRLREG